MTSHVDSFENSGKQMETLGASHARYEHPSIIGETLDLIIHNFFNTIMPELTGVFNIHEITVERRLKAMGFTRSTLYHLLKCVALTQDELLKRLNVVVGELQTNKLMHLILFRKE
ncbi:hypothetical protein TNCV_3802191 [Trichonephila clavipes]|nr:hypothetical protein TNCV_3802191 [Trichonephila clavipes]